MDDSSTDIADMPYRCINVALHRAQVTDCHIDREGRVVEIPVGARTVGEDGEISRLSRVLRLEGVSRFAFAILDNYDVTVPDLSLEDLAAAIDNGFEVDDYFGGLLYDVPWGLDDYDYGTPWGTFVETPSFDLEFTPDPAPHTLDLSCNLGEREPGVSIRIWFERLRVLDERGAIVEPDVFCAETHISQPASRGCAVALIGMALLVVALVIVAFLRILG